MINDTENCGHHQPAGGSFNRSAWKKTVFAIVIKTAVLVIVGYFWFRYVRQNWNELSARSWEIGWRPALLSSILFFAGYCIRGSLWAPMRYALTGVRMPVRDAFRVSAIAWMGRYIPGKIWAVAGKAYLSARDKKQVPQVGVAVIIEVLWFQLSGILLTVIILVFSGELFLSAGIRLALVVLLAIGLIASHPRIFFPIANWILKALRQPPFEQKPRYGRMLLVMLGNISTFLLWSAGFAILVHSRISIDTHDFPIIAGLFSAAWVIGFLILVVPAGIGVRESILVFGLRSMAISDPVIITIVLASRVLMTLIELICFLMALGISAFSNRSAGRDSKLLVILSLCILCICSTSLRAQWSKNGTIIYRMVNAQRPPQIVSGGEYIVWADDRPAEGGIYAQRIRHE